MKKNKKWLFYGTLFLFFFLLCYLFPYSHDDWAWGSSYGIERLETHFKGYNGRWAGNFVVLALTRSNLLKTFIMSFSLTFLLFCVNALTEKGKKMFYLPIFLLLATPYLIFREAVVWTAGFSNYVASLVFVFLFIYLNRELFESKVKDTWIRRILFFVLGFVSVLFVEHVTLYVLALAFLSTLYPFIKYKKVNWSLLVYLVGAILGTIVMFSNSAYLNISAGTDTYRSIGIASFIDSSINSYFTTIYKYFSAHNYVLNLVLSGCILKCLYDYLKRNKKHTKKIYVLSFILVCFPMYNLLLAFSGISLFLKYTKYINGFVTILYFLSVFFSTFFIKDTVRRRKIIFALSSIVLLTAPLFVVTPIGGRCFFPMYIFWIWITLEFYLDAFKEEKKYLKVLVLSGIFLFFTYLICIYGYVFKVNRERISYMKNHNKEESILLPRLPYAKYMWCPDPVNAEFEKRFKLFYGIDVDTEVKFTSYKEWKKLK